ncbi:MAG TPA: GIY-YIG nuclease family protein [Vineibacter sp.]|nr:GIY-YIG nuclease family protein [Vineibacter sp.]
MTERRFYVYFMTNYSRRVLYIGVTNDVERRIWEHRQGKGSEFAKTYHVDRLVYVEEYPTAPEAIAREKQLKGWKRVRKNALVAESNPKWEDLVPEENTPSS